MLKIFGISLSLLLPTIVSAENTQQKVLATRYTPLEPAGSMGSLGFSFGAGAKIQKDPFDSRSPQESDDIAQQIFFSKGLNIPIDFGLVAGQVGETRHAGGHIQWTVYEQFAMPAISWRAGMMRYFPDEIKSMETYSTDILASYSFFRYLTLYGAIGWAQLRNHFENMDHLNEKTLVEVRSIGLRVLALPPFFAATVEATKTENLAPQWAAKLSVRM